MPREIRHTREVPPEWPGLLTLAERLVPDSYSKPTTKVWPMLRLSRQALRLPNEQLFANYYFGLGEIMTGMAYILQPPEVKAKLIKDMASRVIKDALQRRGDSIPSGKPFVPLVADIKPKLMHQPVTEIAREARLGLPPAKRSLVDALHFAANYRRHIRMAQQNVIVAPLLFEHDRRRHSVAQHVAVNAFAGAARVFITLLTGWESKGVLPSEILAMPVPPAALDSAFDATSYIGAARLRLDELHNGEGWVPQDGAYRFDPDYLRTVPPPPASFLAGGEEIPQLYESRFGCPAIQAGGLAREVAEVILPDVIRTVHTFVPREP